MLAPGLLHGWGGVGGRSEAKLPTKQRDAEFGGSLQLTSTVDPGRLPNLAVIDDLDPGSLPISVLRLGGSLVSITGIKRGKPGQLLWLYCYAGSLSIRNNNTGSSAGNRIVWSGVVTGYDLVIGQYESVLLWYDVWTNSDSNPGYSLSPGAAPIAANGCWRVLGKAAASFDAGGAAVVLASTNGTITIAAGGITIGDGSSHTVALIDANSTAGSAGQAVVSDGSSHMVWGDVDPSVHYYNAR